MEVHTGGITRCVSQQMCVTNQMAHLTIFSEIFLEHSRGVRNSLDSCGAASRLAGNPEMTSWFSGLCCFHDTGDSWTGVFTPLCSKGNRTTPPHPFHSPPPIHGHKSSHFLQRLTHQPRFSGGRFQPPGGPSRGSSWTLITAILEELRSLELQ